jgi:cytochrome c oxidase subunit 4
MSTQHDQVAAENRPRNHEGPRNHYFAFALSIVLTMLAFAGVIYGGLDRGFVLAFIVILAVVQAVFQMLYWMHMKDRGHLYPIMFIVMGAFVAVCAVITAVYWMWW